MDDVALLQRRPQRAVQAVLEVELAVPLHGVREQVAVEGRVVVEQRVEGQLALGGGQLSSRTWRGGIIAQSRVDKPWSG